MINLTLLLGSLIALMNTHQADFGVDLGHWESFKNDYAKQYENNDEATMRQAIFFYNKQMIDQAQESNATQALGFSVGLNDLADVSWLEMSERNGFVWPRHKLTGELLDVKNSPEAERFLNSILEDETVEVPDAVDWRKVPGRVSRIKNQGACGSCWAFATTGTLEGQERKVRPVIGSNTTSNRLVELSEQNLVDCDKKNYGCRGGFMKDALEFVHDERGIDDEQSYPYEARHKRCRFKKEKVVLSDKGAAMLPAGDEQKLKQVVAKFGPVAVAIDASSIWFQFYRHGVYYNPFCRNKSDKLDHAVLVVGYGTDPKKGDYWIVKNSWGESYGEKGYIRMARNRKNNCGIATAATIPTF